MLLLFVCCVITLSTHYQAWWMFLKLFYLFYPLQHERISDTTKDIPYDKFHPETFDTIPHDPTWGVYTHHMINFLSVGETLIKRKINNPYFPRNQRFVVSIHLRSTRAVKTLHTFSPVNILSNWRCVDSPFSKTTLAYASPLREYAAFTTDVLSLFTWGETQHVARMQTWMYVAIS